MNSFKRMLMVTVSLALVIGMLPLPGLALTALEGNGFSAKGSVAAPESTTLYAPMGGQVLDFSWAKGDPAEENEVAFSIKPTQICAAEDGVIIGLQAKVGDQAETVLSQYGALCYVERQGIWNVKASTAKAYNKPENRDVRVGAVLRVQTGSGDTEEEGIGTVVRVDGTSFALEMEEGGFELEDTVKLYKGTGTDYKTKDQVGEGKVERPAAIPVTGAGSIASVLVAEGDRVVRGQPLFLVDSASAEYSGENALPEIRFPESGLIGDVLAQAGQFVVQGQAMMTLLPSGETEATLEVDELDISKVRLGQNVRVTVDAYPGQEWTATVKEICPIGTTVLDTTKFTVRVSFADEAEGFMIGMHVVGYWE